MTSQAWWLNIDPFKSGERSNSISCIMGIHISFCIHTYTHTHTHTHIHIYNMHIHMHAYTHTHIHTQVFEKLHDEQPAVFEKLLPVAGDIMEPGLGLNESDMQLLIDNVAVVFHLAATIRFDAPLRCVFVCVCVCVCVCMCVTVVH